MKLSKFEKKILVEIFQASNGLFLFTIHRQLSLSPKELFLAIENLKTLELIEVNDDRVTITRKGFDFSISRPLKTKSNNREEKNINEDFLGRKIKINEFYIPLNFEK